MDSAEYLLGILPPGLAIALEVMTPLRERYFGIQATQIANSQMGAAQPGPSEADVKQALSTTHLVLKTSMAGAASIAGLGPTIVSFFMTALTIFHAVHNSYPWLVGLAVVGILLVLLVISTISGRNLFDLEAVKLRLFGWPLVKPTKFFSLLIYATNGVVIGGFTAVYRGWLS